MECNSSTTLAQLYLVFSLQDRYHILCVATEQQSFQRNSENIQISGLYFQIPNLLNKDTKSIHECTAFLNTFVAIKYIKKHLKCAIITYNILCLYHFV